MKALLVIVGIALISSCSNLVPERSHLSERDTRLHLLDYDRDGVSSYWDQCPATPNHVAVTARGCPRDQDGDGVPDYLDLCDATQIGTRVTSRGCGVNGFSGVDIKFEFDSSLTSPTVVAQLNRLVSDLERVDWKADDVIVVTGHTDDRGTSHYNQGLSERRAQVVAEFISRHANVRVGVVVRAVGESRPVASNSDENGRIENRRVEVVRESNKRYPI